MREGFVTTDAGRLWYAAYGEGKKGTPLLVMHGGPGFLSMTETVDQLADERPVYFYDQLGCGRSDRAKDNGWYSPERYVAELDVVRKALGLDEAVLMGFSWGAMLTCLYMLERKRTGAKHGGVKGLVLCGPYLSTPLWDADQRCHVDDPARQPLGLQVDPAQCDKPRRENRAPRPLVRRLFGHEAGSADNLAEQLLVAGDGLRRFAKRVERI